MESVSGINVDSLKQGSGTPGEGQGAGGVDSPRQRIYHTYLPLVRCQTLGIFFGNAWLCDVVEGLLGRAAESTKGVPAIGEGGCAPFAIFIF